MFHLVVALLSIIIVIIGVTFFKWHAFISLLVATLFLAIFSGLSLDKIVTSIETGVGGTLGHYRFQLLQLRPDAAESSHVRWINLQWLAIQ